MEQQRATCWSLTINNPTEVDEEAIALARQRGWKVDGQKECGKEGTVHYQLALNTPQVRFSAVKKVFPRAHIEIARNPQALHQYVNKDDTAIGKLASSSEMYPSQAKVWDMWYEWRQTEQHDLIGRPDLLDDFDLFVCVYIKKGYYIEQIAVNPQTRSAIKSYGGAILARSEKLFADRQTDKTKARLDAKNIVEPGEYNEDNALCTQDYTQASDCSSSP